MATGGSVFRTGASVFLNLIPRSRITNHFKCRMHAWLYIFRVCFLNLTNFNPLSIPKTKKRSDNVKWLCYHANAFSKIFEIIIAVP